MEHRPPAFDSSLPAEPEAITASFIADYKAWNDFAFAVSQARQKLEPVEDSYDALIVKYCLPGKRGQALAFGDPSAHSPETSELIAVKGKGDRRKVMVREKSALGHFTLYQFDFAHQEGRWFLDEVYYVDEGRRNRRIKGL